MINDLFNDPLFLAILVIVVPTIVVMIYALPRLKD